MYTTINSPKPLTVKGCPLCTEFKPGAEIRIATATAFHQIDKLVKFKADDFAGRDREFKCVSCGKKGNFSDKAEESKS